MKDVNNVIIKTLYECSENLDFVAKGNVLNVQLISAVGNTLNALAYFIESSAKLKRDL